jgi:hypothetical protein
LEKPPPPPPPPPVKRLGETLGNHCVSAVRYANDTFARKYPALVKWRPSSIIPSLNLTISHILCVYIHILYRHNAAHKFRVADNIVHVYYSVSWNLSLSNWSAVISMTDPGPACIPSCSSHSLRNMEVHSWRMIYNSRPINPI